MGRMGNNFSTCCWQATYHILMWRWCRSVQFVVIQKIFFKYLSIYFETEGHDFTSETVSSEECLHAVCYLHLLTEHVPQQLIEQVLRIKQRHKHTSQLILTIIIHELSSQVLFIFKRVIVSWYALVFFLNWTIWTKVVLVTLLCCSFLSIND